MTEIISFYKCDHQENRSKEKTIIDLIRFYFNSVIRI